MSLQVTKSFIRIVIILMTFECINTAFALPHEALSDTHQKATVHGKSTHISTAFSAMLLEKAEGEEKNDEDRNSLVTIELADFNKIAVFLSQFHSPRITFVPTELRFNLKPSLFKLFCIYLI